MCLSEDQGTNAHMFLCKITFKNISNYFRINLFLFLNLFRILKWQICFIVNRWHLYMFSWMFNPVTYNELVRNKMSMKDLIRNHKLQLHAIVWQLNFIALEQVVIRALHSTSSYHIRWISTNDYTEKTIWDFNNKLTPMIVSMNNEIF
jgi:hypothetical protein